MGASPERAGRRATAAATGPSSISVVVPFVGCPSDGQVGLRDAPKATTRTVAIGTGEARKLAYYSSRYLGVLAPRGWYCFGTYGSNGETLYVSPQPVDTRLIAANGSGFTGSAVQISVEIGDTSGRFGVARAVARVFPAHVAFARRVIAEGIEPASAFPFGPYPNDELTYKSQEIVEYQTPANTEGLGTRSWLRKNGSAIAGVAILSGPTPDLVHVSLRLPTELTHLASAIIQQVERDELTKRPGQTEGEAAKEIEPAPAKSLPVTRLEVLRWYTPPPQEIGRFRGAGTTIYTYAVPHATLELEERNSAPDLVRATLKFSIPMLAADKGATALAVVFDSGIFALEIAGLNFGDRSTTDQLGLTTHLTAPGPDEMTNNGVRVRRFTKGGVLFFELTPE